MKLIIQFLLKGFTVLIIRKYKPFIIAVTGSVGKTSTKEAIYTAFSDKIRMRKSAGNLNTEIGAPLVFFGVEKSGESIIDWLKIFLKGISILLKKDKNYPQVIIVEIAADKPGDIDYLTNFIKPDIAIITAIGEIPVHIEFYKNPEEVAKEKEKIIFALKKDGLAILNIDDKHINKMIEKHKNKKIITYGFSEGADIKIKNFETKSLRGSDVYLEHLGNDYSAFLSQCIGDPFAYISGIVFAVGIVLQIKEEEIPQLIEKIKPIVGRLYLLRGEKETIILDGSYNSSPSSMTSALRALKGLPGKRKIAVIGDMLELGKYSNEEHEKVGKIASVFCDYLFFVGEHAEELKKFVIKEGIKEGNVFSFKKSEEAIGALKSIMNIGDIILVKGSQGIRTEKIVLAIMEDKENAEKLLVRQSKSWKKK